MADTHEDAGASPGNQSAAIPLTGGAAIDPGCAEPGL